MRLFVSYSSQDTAIIENLKTALRRGHQQVWMDEELGGGEAWWRTILEQIRECEVFIVALSNNSLASKPCQAELRYAQALQRPILPVQIGPVSSMRVTPLAATQIIDFRNPTVEAGIELIGALHEQRATLQPLPAELPEEPPVPFAYLMRLANNLAEPQLSAREQADYVSELKDALEQDGDDPAARSDIRQLLCMLRDRPDVLWRTRTDIENVLASIDKTASASPPGGDASPIQDFQSQSGQPAYPASPVRPWQQSGPASQHQPVMNTGTPNSPPGGGPRPGMGGPPPSGPYGPYYTGGTGEPRRRSRRGLLIGGSVGAAVLLVIVIAVALVGWSGSNSTTPTTTVPTVPPERLDSILLNAAQVNTIMGASNMQPGKLGQAPADPSAKLSAPECSGALYPGLTLSYQGTGYTKLNYLVLAEPGDNNQHFVDEDAAAFPSSDQARAFVKTSVAQWKSCGGQTVTATYDNGNAYRWTLGTLGGDVPKITQLDTQENGGGWACQRVLSAVSNVVIDVKACGNRITNEANQIGAQMGSNVMQ